MVKKTEMEIVINEYRETQVQKKDDCKGCDASDIKEKTEDRKAIGKLDRGCKGGG
jgi:hypothetical protein